MLETLSHSSDQEQQPKTKIDTKKDPNGFVGKNVYEIRQKIEKMKKPEAQEFFDFWWLVTQNKNGKRKIDMKVSAFDAVKDQKTGKREYVKDNTVKEYTSSSYQTFNGNTLTIMINVEGDLNIDDESYPIDTKKFPKWKEDFATDYAEEKDPSGEDIQIPRYDHTLNNNDTKIQLSPNGRIILQTKSHIENGMYTKNDNRSDPILIDGKRAVDFISALKDKFLERFVNRKDDKGITDNELNYILDRQ